MGFVARMHKQVILPFQRQHPHLAALNNCEYCRLEQINLSSQLLDN